MGLLQKSVVIYICFVLLILSYIFLRKMNSKYKYTYGNQYFLRTLHKNLQYTLCHRTIVTIEVSRLWDSVF